MDPVTALKAAQIGVSLARSRKVRWLIAAVVVAQVVALTGYLLLPMAMVGGLAGGREQQRQSVTTSDTSCTTGLGDDPPATAGTRGLSGEQVQNARTIWRVGLHVGAGSAGAIVAIATAMQESALRNVSYGDRDSLGLFQQRASWGTAATRRNPSASARLFYAALLEVKGWRAMPLTVAAQTVQRSAFPDAYARHERLAAGLVAVFSASSDGDASLNDDDAQAAAAGGMCGAGDAATCPVTQLPVEAGLTPDALRTLRCVATRWPAITTFGGVGDRPGNVDRDHQEGRAVDVMIPGYPTPAGRALGQQVADWLIANQRRVGVKYIIWQARIWSVDRADEGWRTCGTAAASCYSGTDDTAAHRDHVHVSVYGNRAGAYAGGAVDGVVRPVDHYVITARFGQCSSHWAACHTGLDFAASTGTPIHSVAGGTVTWTGWGGAYGYLTKIEHATGLESWYAHQSRQDVHVGDHLSAGQVIGAVGATGNTTGPHLHLEIRQGGQPVDPAQWLMNEGARP